MVIVMPTCFAEMLSRLYCALGIGGGMLRGLQGPGGVDSLRALVRAWCGLRKKYCRSSGKVLLYRIIDPWY
jgi:hypothetical protein